MKYLVANYLKKSGNYTESEVATLLDSLQMTTCEKGELLLERGDICSAISFIIEGAVCQYKLDSDGDKIVIDLNISNEWVINHKSFTSRQPSANIIEAYKKTRLFSLSIETIHKLIEQSQSYLQLGKILDESTGRIQIFDNNLNPDEKYQYIMDQRPRLLQEFPQTLIASYLKITPETLSRVRKRFTKS